MANMKIHDSFVSIKSDQENIDPIDNSSVSNSMLKCPTASAKSKANLINNDLKLLCKETISKKVVEQLLDESLCKLDDSDIISIDGLNYYATPIKHSTDFYGLDLSFERCLKNETRLTTFIDLNRSKSPMSLSSFKYKYIDGDSSLLKSPLKGKNSLLSNISDFASSTPCIKKLFNKNTNTPEKSNTKKNAPGLIDLCSSTDSISCISGQTLSESNKGHMNDFINITEKQNICEDKHKASFHCNIKANSHVPNQITTKDCKNNVINVLKISPNNNQSETLSCIKEEKDFDVDINFIDLEKFTMLDEVKCEDSDTEECENEPANNKNDEEMKPEFNLSSSMMNMSVSINLQYPDKRSVNIENIKEEANISENKDNMQKIEKFEEQIVETNGEKETANTLKSYQIPFVSNNPEENADNNEH